MLSILRKKAGSWMIKVLLGAIVIVFVFWGVGSYRSQKANRVASVNGNVITRDDYKSSYNRLLDQMRQRFGKLNDDMIKMLRVEQQALNQLIDQKLLLDEARRLGFRVTDHELAGSIRKIGAFQSAGVFDGGIYKRVLNSARLTPEAFEILQRESMLMNKLKSFILANAKVSDLEAEKWFNWENASIKIDYVLFEPDQYKNIETLDDELNIFFDKNKESYRTEPKVKVNYIYFKPETYSSKINVSDDEIKEYYESNREKFKTEKSVTARHILLKTDPKDSDEQVEEKRKKALEILKMAKDGKDFAELAKEFSEGPTKSKGGMLGEFKQNEMVKPFADQAFSMKPGEISDPVKTQFGWHIIKVEKVNEAKELSLKEAEEKIRKQFIDERSMYMAYDHAEAVYDGTFEADDLQKVAESYDIPLITTDFFTKAGPNKGIKNRYQFAQAAFSLSKGDLSEIIDLKDGYCILQVIETKPAVIPELKEVETTVRADLISEKQSEKAKADANQVYSALKDGTEMATACKPYGLTVKTTDYFKRNDSIPDIGYDRTLTAAAFQLSAVKRMPDGPVKGTKGYYVIRFKERKLPATEEFQKEKNDIITTLRVQKENMIFETMLSRVKEHCEIIVEDPFKKLLSDQSVGNKS